MMMQRTNRTYKWLVMLWLMLIGGVWSPMAVYTRVAQPSLWQKTPTMSTDVCPSYKFRSTSSTPLVVGQTSYTAEPYHPSQPASGPRRARQEYDPWDETDPSDDLGVGEVDNPAPIGEPLILLIFAMLYIVWNLFAYVRKKQYLCSRKGF